MNDKESLEEQLAQVLYHSGGGMTDEDYKMIFEKERPLWKLPDGVSVKSEGISVLEEWQRDDFRIQAREVISFFEANGLDIHASLAHTKKELKWE